MSDFLSKIQSRIDALKDEIHELEIAAKVYQRLGSNGQTKDSDPFLMDLAAAAKLTPRGDLVGSKVREAALKILGEARMPMYYKDVFNRAMARGWRGRKGTGAAVSFWATMQRNPALFQALGDGRYQLPLKGGAAQGKPGEAKTSPGDN